MNNAPEPVLDDLYRDLILDHYRHPRNRGHLADATTKVEGYNPLCGDEIEVTLRMDDGEIADVAFVGRGCSISQASGSMMTDIVKGRSREDALRIAEEFRYLMTHADSEAPEELGDLEAFAGVAKFPVRVKCATLAWRVLEEGLSKGSGAVVETESV
jgi:nitrogen fixation NifU-like protein